MSFSCRSLTQPTTETFVSIPTASKSANRLSNSSLGTLTRSPPEVCGSLIRSNDYTIRNGKIYKNSSPLYVHTGTLNIENCEIETTSGIALDNLFGTVNIRNCTIKNTGGEALHNSKGTVNISENVNIEGEMVNNKNMNVYSGRYNFDPTEYVDANNLTVTQEDAYWVVNNNRR